MLGNRILILLGVSVLAASTALADDVGYVDCNNHSEDTQVFAKPRKTPDVMAAIPCGQRFTVITYGFFFSRVQTSDGKVGYIYSSLIAVDRAATSAQKAGSVQMAAEKVKVPSTAAQTAPAASVQRQSAPAQPAVTASNASTQNTEAGGAQPTAAVTAQSQSTVVQPATTQPAATAPAASPTTNTSEPAATVAQPMSPAPAQPQPVSAQPAPMATSASPSNATAKADMLAQPNPPAAAVQPEAATAEPVAPAIRPANDRTSWEKPNPTVRTAPLMELYGGFAFARVAGSGSGTNLMGALGSFGFSIKPWLQIVADTSYNVQSSSGVKNILYGNHYGPRFFLRGRNRWGITPFGEALVGGTRADSKFSGSSTYNTSDNCFSFKVGGGLDMHPSRHIDIRLFDADYYRTSFGTNAHQNNYWISTGIVIRLFGGRE